MKRSSFVGMVNIGDDDTTFCMGPYDREELRRAEELYNLPAKELVFVGAEAGVSRRWEQVDVTEDVSLSQEVFSSTIPSQPLGVEPPQTFSLKGGLIPRAVSNNQILLGR